MRSTSWPLSIIILAFIFTATAGGRFDLAAQPAGAESNGAPEDEMAFLDGVSLVVLETEDIPSLQLARRMIRSYGGSVAVMSPPLILIGWVPPGAREKLLGKAEIQEIYTREVLPSELPSRAVRTNPAIGFFNRAVRGDIAREHRNYTQAVSSGAPRPPRQPDVRTADPLDEGAYLENLRAVGLDIDALAEEELIDRSSPAAMGNSDYMTGTVALTIFFVESNGSGPDPDLYTWTPDAMDYYLDGVYSGLIWWSNRTVTHGDCWVSFLVNYFSGSETRCQQWVEPIRRGHRFHGDRGFTGGFHLFSDLRGGYLGIRRRLFVLGVLLPRDGHRRPTWPIRIRAPSERAQSVQARHAELLRAARSHASDARCLRRQQSSRSKTRRFGRRTRHALGNMGRTQRLGSTRGVGRLFLQTASGEPGGDEKDDPVAVVCVSSYVA